MNWSDLRRSVGTTTFSPKTSLHLFETKSLLDKNHLPKEFFPESETSDEIENEVVFDLHRLEETRKKEDAK